MTSCSCSERAAEGGREAAVGRRRCDVAPGLSDTPSSSRMTELWHGPRALVETRLVNLMHIKHEQSRRQQHRVEYAPTHWIMEYFSLKRSTVADRGQANLSSKVYVRSTKSGKVQKIVRELYLRQDIPCSSNLCRECLEIAPTDYSKKGGFILSVTRVLLTRSSHTIRALRYTFWFEELPQRAISRPGYQCFLDWHGSI